MIKLFKKDSLNIVRVWTIEPTTRGYAISWGIRGKKMREYERTVYYIKNNRTLKEQIEFEIDKRVNEQLDRKYSATSPGSMK